MSRTQSQGIEYFPFAVDFFSDKKIKVLKARYGADGITIYIYLLCYVYREGYYTRVDKDFIYMVSDDLNMSPDKVQQVMTFLFERSMFHEQLFKSDAILTSTGIQERWQKAISTRAKKTPIEVSGYWLLKKSETQPFIKCALYANSSEKKELSSENYSDNSEKNTLYKVKESKYPPISPQGDGERDFKGEFFKAYPKLKLGFLDDGKVDYRLLLSAFEKSKVLRERYSMHWILKNYDAIIRGDYIDAEGAETATAARERWCANRKAAAENFASKALKTALNDVMFSAAYSKWKTLMPRAAFEKDAEKAAWLTAELELAEKEWRGRLDELGLDIEPHYYCEKCKDTGFLPNGKPCDCYEGG